jgi:arginine/lysine/ornithine decarboxylase
VSDIKRISEICHKNRVPLLVDEAHGAHFGFGFGFPESAVTCGADITVQSIHKTLAGLTQTALIHLNGDLIDRVKVKRALTIFQSSSPSYILSASIDGCVRLLRQESEALFDGWKNRLDRFYDQISTLKYFKLLQQDRSMYAFDRSKLVILTWETGVSGKSLADMLLDRYKIMLEMSAPGYALAMTGIGDSDENFARLAEALIGIDDDCQPNKNTNTLSAYALPRKLMKASEADNLKKEMLPLEAALEKICGEYVMAYPPGVPILVPGEIIGEESIRLLQNYITCGIAIKSDNSGFPAKICVIHRDKDLNCE